jgi:hypothetical protein
MRLEDPETKTEGTMTTPGRMRSAYAAAPLRGGKRLEKKKARGGRRKSLKRLDSAKEMEGINLDFLPVFL